MTCRDHVEPIAGCVGCLGRWDRAMAERVIEDYSVAGIVGATLRMALAEIDRLEDERSTAVTERLGAVVDADGLRRRCEALTQMIGTDRDANSLRSWLRTAKADRAALLAQRAADLAEAAATYEAMRAEIARLVEELGHATLAGGGDWLSKTSRAMCETMLGERDALRAKVREQAAEIEALRCGDLVPFVDGELSPERAAAFREHLGQCATCQVELVRQQQLTARLSEAGR